MPPTVILIRHAEALHNKTQDFGIPDPGLTQKGKSQCEELAKFLQEEFPLIKDAGLIVTSPLKRTLETTQIGLGWLIDQGVPVLLKAEWQETTDKPCDTGVPVAEAQEAWKQFDFSTLDSIYPAKKGLYAYNQQALTTRISNCIKWLQNRPEKVVVVVSHSGFMRRLSLRKYGNADFRVFDFNQDNQFSLREGSPGNGERGVSPIEPSMPKEHWAGIKKSSSFSDLAGATELPGLHTGQQLEVPDVPSRPRSR